MTQWEALYFSLPFFSFLVCKSCVSIVTSDEKNVDVRKLSVWARSLWGDLEHFSLRIITDVQSMLSFGFFISGILLLAALLFFVGYLVQEYHADITYICDDMYEVLFPVIFSLQTLLSALRIVVSIILSYANAFALLLSGIYKAPHCRATAMRSCSWGTATTKATACTRIAGSRSISGANVPSTTRRATQNATRPL
jgi:hypothetical protein